MFSELKILILSVLLILFQTFQLIPARQRQTYCKNEPIFRVGTKTICEYLFTRKPVSCWTPIQVNTKAFISCRYGYSNKQNLVEQRIGCTYSGEWSETPMDCEDVCEGKPTNVTHTPKQPFYIEMKGITSSCPSVILNAKILLAPANCILEYRPHDLQLETIEPDPQTLVVKALHYDNRQPKRSNGKYDDNVVAIVELDNNIIYDPYVRSACIDFSFPQFSNQREFIEQNLEKFKSTKTLDYSYVRSPCSLDHFLNKIQNENAVMYQCFSGSRQIPCDQSLEQGSVVRIRCKIGYQKFNTKSPDEIKCISGGKWNHEVDHQCSLICGQLDIEKPSIIPLVSNGKPIDIINVPWHVGVYANNTGTQKFEQNCGGTLVHSNIVISAAHCFFNEAKNGLDPESSFYIASGKRYRNFDSFERYAQFSRIKRIYIPSTYNANYFRHDIAVVVLEDHLLYDTHTRPACIDWFPYGKYDVEAGKKGRVVGWGATSPTSGSSSELLAIELITLSNKKCRTLVEPKDRAEITGEKFCAIGNEGSSACSGDSGGGFLIKKRYNYDEDRYHLWGVVSSGINGKDHCSPKFLTTYINVQYHQDIIKSIIEENINNIN